MSAVYRRNFACAVVTWLVLGAVAARADDEPAARTDKAASENETAGKDWLRDYLANKMNYNEQQIEQFTANVAELSRGELVSLLEKLKWRRELGESQREISLAAHRRSLQRISAEKSQARKQTSKPSFHGYTPPTRKRRPSPSQRGLYRGSYVIIRVN